MMLALSIVGRNNADRRIEARCRPFARMTQAAAKRRLACLAGVIAILGLGAPAQGRSQESTARAIPRTIEEVVVVGSRARIESRVVELPVAVDLFQGFDLDRTGEIDLGAALTKLAPSFNYMRLSVGRWRPAGAGDTARSQPGPDAGAGQRQAAPQHGLAAGARRP